ncbi:MAG: signal peptidase I [Tenericutes bacterium]|nr:signal peptidase I [Mycoplasmatota bacterium]
MDEEIYLEENTEQFNENKKLMSRSPRRIISFFTLLIICMILFIILQSNKFFIFNINRSFDNVPNPMIAQLFSYVFIVIIILGILSYIYLTISYIKRKKLNNDNQLETIDKYKKIYNISDIFSIVPIFLVFVLIVNGFFYSFAQVDGSSMQPTFCNNDAVIIRYSEDFEQNDIVIFELEETDGSLIYLIKRLKAGPGDKLVVDSTGVWVNNILVEDDVDSRTQQYHIESLPEGVFYVLGDNRSNSVDSRVNGLIAQEDMIGKVVVKLSNQTCPLN